MNLKQKIELDMKKALKERNNSELSVLRMLLDRIQKQEKSKQGSLNEEEMLQVLRTYKKQVEEELTDFKKVGTNIVRIEALSNELEFVKKYLPKQMSEDQVRDVVKKYIAEYPQSKKGDVMKAMMIQLKGKADNKRINSIVTLLAK